MPAGTARIVMGPEGWVFDGRQYTAIPPLVAELNLGNTKSVLLKYPDKMATSKMDVNDATKEMHRNGIRRIFLHTPRGAIDALGMVQEFYP
jgi:hypothetical protein